MEHAHHGVPSRDLTMRDERRVSVGSITAAWLETVASTHRGVTHLSHTEQPLWRGGWWWCGPPTLWCGHPWCGCDSPR